MKILPAFLSELFNSDLGSSASLSKQIIATLVSVADIDRLMQAVLSELLTSLKVNNGALVVLKNGVVGRVEFVGYPDQVPFSGTDLAWLLTQTSSLISSSDLTNPLEKDFFAAKNLALIVTLGPSAERVGYLLLGKKLDGSAFTTRDRTLLESLAPQITIALKNAESRRQIEEFNATLSGKVAERTRQLEESQQAQLKLKDEFVFIATHDLATPVTAISGYTAMINARGEPVSDTLKQNLQAITEASERLKILVNDLLQVARSDAGTIKVQVTKIDAAPIIQAATTQSAPLAAEKGLQIHLNLASSNYLLADSRKLAEIIENLLSNAIKYNKPNGSVTITTVTKDQSFELMISDTGLGIPVAEHPKVFTKFFRSDDPEVRARPGTGLGLFVVRMLTEKMGGTIRFESTPSVGTTFVLSFKRAN